MKNKLQPTRTSFSRNFQCKKAPRWLSKFFHFGTENRADQLKKPPCTYWGRGNEDVLRANLRSKGGGRRKTAAGIHGVNITDLIWSVFLHSLTLSSHSLLLLLSFPHPRPLLHSQRLKENRFKMCTMFLPKGSSLKEFSNICTRPAVAVLSKSTQPP